MKMAMCEFVHGLPCVDVVGHITKLEKLVLALFKTMNTLRINGHAPTGRQLDHYEKRMRELGIEVDE